MKICRMNSRLYAKKHRTNTEHVKNDLLATKKNEILLLQDLLDKEMSEKRKQVSAPTQSKKRGYIVWNTQMDTILISVLYNQLNQGNKGDGEWKPQAYQAVVDELRNKLDMSLTTENVRNRVKIWKKHYGVIMEIRTQTKFKWDEEKKMVVIAIEDLPEWMKYTQANPSAASYSNKSIDHWEDICVLVGPDRAIGDGGEHHEEGATMMDEEACDGASSSVDTTSSSSKKKQKRDNLAEAVTSVAHTLKSYVEARLKATPTLGGKEVYDEVSNVIGILRPQVLKAAEEEKHSIKARIKLLKKTHEETSVTTDAVEKLRSMMGNYSSYNGRVVDCKMPRSSDMLTIKIIHA